MNDDDKRKVENQLMVMGFAGLNDANLIPQMALLIRDHDWFQGMLASCEPVKRREMYEALKPYLKFDPWPLHVYIDRVKERAAAIESSEKPIQLGDKKYQETSKDDAVGVVVKLTCHKCTRFEEFYGSSVVMAVIEARGVGWVRDVVLQKEICPKCPSVKVN